MKRALPYLNLLGVLVLVGLCVLQWRANRRANLEVNRLEKIQIDQSVMLGEKEKSLKGSAADLDNFRKQVERLAGETREAESKLAEVEKRRQTLADEREAFIKREDEWHVAITSRNEQIKRANADLNQLANERNDAIKRFNELVEKYNALAKEISELRAKGSSADSLRNRAQAFAR